MGDVDAVYMAPMRAQACRHLCRSASVSRCCCSCGSERNVFMVIPRLLAFPVPGREQSQVPS